MGEIKLPPSPQQQQLPSTLPAQLPSVLPAEPLPSVLPAENDVTSEAARLGGPLGAAAMGALKGASEATKISPLPQTTPMEKAAKAVETVAQIPTAPVELVSHALGSLTDSLSSYTPEGRAEHPILSKVGDALSAARELLTGGQSAGKPMGTSSGVLNNPVTVALSAAPSAAETAAAAQERLLQAVRGAREARVAKAAAQTAKAAAQAANITKATPEMFEPLPEPPQPMHGPPLEVESPLDSATISKEGGKGLSPEAVEALQHRQGTTIPIGSNKKNILMRDVQPNSQTIETLATKMNKMVQDAPPVEQNVWDGSDVQQKLKDLEASIPASEREKGAANIADEIQNNVDALHSNNLQEILEARRQLGRRIDWENLTNIPETPKETVNSARAVIYRALGDKVHEAVPETVAVDGQLQPNIELRSYYRNRLGDRAVDDPVGAAAEATSEFQKGKKVIDTKAYNDQVAQNRKIAGLDEPTGPGGGKMADALDKIVDKVDTKLKGLGQPDEDSLRRLVFPAMKPGNLWGVNTDWNKVLTNFDKLTPEEQAARFSDPAEIRSLLRSKATWFTVARTVKKYGSWAAFFGAIEPQIRHFFENLLTGQ